MRKKPVSIDGFIPRRADSSIGEQHVSSSPSQRLRGRRPTIGVARPQARPDELPRPVGSVSRSEVDESLAGIDNEEQPKRKRGLFRRRRGRRILTRKQKIVRRIIIACIVLLILIGGFVLIRAFLNSNKIFKGNFFDIFQSQPLKMDANGRSNVLVFGTSEDDPGHEAGSLTDSIMVISIDQNKKNAYMVSIPRDLYVQYDAACVSGYEGKINVMYGCYSDDGKHEAAGAKALQKKVGEVLGLDIQYYAHVNYTVVRDVVKALGGIKVKIESRDPRGIMDSNFDWKCRGGDEYASYATRVKNCPPNGHFIDYPNGVVKLDAEHALYLAQARGDAAPTYGLEQSNFDREKNQQKIIKAIREKAVSAGTITDIGKVTGLMDALGNNLRTNFATSEIRTLLQLGQDIPSDKIKPLTFVEEGNELVTSTMIGGASSVVPVLGTYDYTQIQAYIKKSLSSDPVIREEANIVVLNASGEAGAAQAEADTLTAAGYTLQSTGNAPAGNYSAITIYQLSKDKPGTAKALAKRYDVKVKKSDPPFDVIKDADFVIVIGKGSSNTAN